MPSPNPKLLFALGGKELRQIFASRSLLAALLIASMLVGFGFAQAVALFSEASRAALEHKELAPGMNPLDGVLVPTFGSLYLITTLLFPFVAIRPLGTEIQSGTLKLLTQLPTPLTVVVATKMVATLVAWGLILALPLIGVASWTFQGGHLYLPELATLTLGHALYAFVIIGVSFLVSSLTRSTSTAAILVLAVTLGSWVLDFTATTHSEGLVRSLSSLSLTSGLREFERGLLSVSTALRYLLLGGTASALSIVFCHGALDVTKKVTVGVIAFGTLGFGLWGLAQIGPSWDFSESRRNSLSQEDELIFRTLEDPLSIRVFLTPDDPRYRDLNRSVLSKLRRIVPRVSIRLADTGKIPLYGTGGKDNYGLNEYEYAGRIETSRSSSPNEILPLLHHLIGKGTSSGEIVGYPGYPVVIDTEFSNLISFLLLPILLLVGWWAVNRVSKTTDLYDGGFRL